jgi:N-acyl-D-aspartate/D-glutamate deacylase
MLDVLIRGARVIDGTGKPGFQADVGVQDGRVVALGKVDHSATRTIDAAGLALAPGFIDPHTHYDAQIFWDPFLTPSNLHGVTTVIGGNCGFSLAPIGARDADYIRRMMVKVEGMPLAALEHGIEWNWSSFGEYLDRLEGHVGLNAAFLVGHCALRRSVMGDDAVGTPAAPEQIAKMAQLLHASLAAGGFGFSSSQAFTHSDGDGNPVPSRFGGPEEMLAFSAAVGEHPGTTLELIVDGCMTQFGDAEVNLMIAMSRAANRPVNWNVMQVSAANRGRHEHQLAAGTRAKRAGARIVALTMPMLGGVKMSFLDYCALNLLPGWAAILDRPIPERLRALADPATRRKMRTSAEAVTGALVSLQRWGAYEIGETYAPQNEGLTGRTVDAIAKERGADPFETLFDIVVADELRTGLWPQPSDDDADSWQLRLQVWRDERAMIGGSDAGAHLDRMCGARYPTIFLGDVVRERGLLALEEAVHMMTDVPARFFGLKARGRIAEGWHADLVLFDPRTIASEPIRMRADLPGNSERLFAGARGIERVFVNGVEIVCGGKQTGNLPGRILRSGRDTETVPVHA